MKKEPVYTEFKTDMLEHILGLIITLKGETRPVAGHDDPGAITDAWNSLLEIGKLVAQKARQAVEVEDRLQKCIDLTKWEIEKAPEDSITSKLLSTGRMNGYTFVMTWFRGPERGRLYSAKREQMRNDLFWDFVTPDDFEIIKWSGYNDNNWWVNVVKVQGQIQRKDKRGRVWELNPRTDTVTLIKDCDK